jgi:hypothetical protein
MILVAITMLLVAESSSGQLDDSRFFHAARATLASEVDATQPPVPLEEWLRRIAGEQVSFRWEVNDCGEQTGDHAVDSKRDVPVCGGLAAALPSGAVVEVTVHLGSHRQGLRRGRGLYGAWVRDGGKSRSFRTLTELAHEIRRLRKAGPNKAAAGDGGPHSASTGARRA